MRAATASPDVEDALIPLSALQHYLFCPRQCALIHVEQVWTEDQATAEGRLLHERVDAGGFEARGAVRTARSLQIRSLQLGVVGRADVVELRGVPARPYPIEYKRGRPKPHRADEVQLCAQALCLEEMVDQVVEEGALFYGQTRRRTVVAFDETLRALTFRIADETRAMMATGRTPPPSPKPACRRCSLQEACRPDRMHAAPKVGRWLASQMSDADAPEALPE
jgi:CRISPR-associated exonuclease Cas4